MAKSFSGVFVYLIGTSRDSGCGAPVKVGITASLSSRLNQIQNGSAYDLEILSSFPCTDRESARRVEAEFHILFQKSRMNGEWFDLHPDIADRALVNLYRSEAQTTMCRTVEQRRQLDIFLGLAVIE